jgi:N-acetylmuramoyl-L-alanine amidase
MPVMRLVSSRIALVAVVLGLSIPSPTHAAKVRVHLEKGLLTVTSVELGGVEYLSLANVAKATGGSLQRLGTPGGYRLRFPKSSITLKVGSSDIRVAGKTVSLSEPSRRIGRAIAAPLELLPIALEERYGEGRVHWDPKARVARVVSKAASLRLLRFRSYPGYTRVVLEGTRRHDFVLKDDVPGRVVLDIRRGVLSPSIRSTDVDDGVLVSIDPRQGGRDSRVVMQVTDRFASSKAFALANPHRIVIDLFSRAQDAPRRLAADGAASAAKAGQPVGEPATVGPGRRSGPPPPAESVTTVVIDPGHGGRDPGAIGQSGIMEKDVVLDIGRRLKPLIEERLGMRAVLTRSEDVFLPLEERAAIANRHKADFFISLHVNAAPRSHAVGFETYFLSREPSDRGARASAVRENTVLSLEGIGVKEQESLKAILWDMAQTFYVRESSELAESVLNKLARISGVNNRGVKSAPFFVLIGAAMPSILVEAGFITNPREERKLTTGSYRQEIAEALLTGIAKFKDRYEKRVGMVPGTDPS